MIHILFVCHGNICRSPMAEFIFRHMAEERHAAHRFTVSSAATSTEEIHWDGTGNPVYPPARAELKKHGIDFTGKRAVQLKREDYGKYDLLVGMDRANIRNMHWILGGDPEGKIRMLMDYTNRPGDVADPWYTENFDVTYRDIAEGCAALLEKMLKEGKG